MSRITTIRSRLGKLALAGLLGVLLFSSSGCVLFWLGAGGAGGYLIKKGEDEGNSSKKERTEASKESSTKKSQ